MNTRDIVTGNFFDKFKSKNPIHRLLIWNFLQCMRMALDRAGKASTIVDVGCGTGELAKRLLESTNMSYTGIDIDHILLEETAKAIPGAVTVFASAEHLPLPDGSCDLVLCSEVLEHLMNPVAAIAEFRRISKRWLLVSVPREPMWRILNICRGAYLRQFGNTPGHFQHFGLRDIRNLVRSFGNIVLELRPLPWTILLVERSPIVSNETL